jgi:hypothetical protein
MSTAIRFALCLVPASFVGAALLVAGCVFAHDTQTSMTDYAVALATAPAAPLVASR